MQPIFLIVGPPAVGKSSTSRALAARYPKSIHIPVDDIRNMVVSGIRLPGADWNSDLMEQISLARRSVSLAALNYHEAGFVVVMDDFWDESRLSDYEALFSQPNFHKIILLPGQTQAHQRNLKRSGEGPARAYIDDGIRIVYQQLAEAAPQLPQEGWRVIDTTSMSVDETVAFIQQCCTSGES